MRINFDYFLNGFYSINSRVGGPETHIMYKYKILQTFVWPIQFDYRTRNRQSAHQLLNSDVTVAPTHRRCRRVLLVDEN